MKRKIAMGARKIYFGLCNPDFSKKFWNGKWDKVSATI